MKDKVFCILLLLATCSPAIAQRGGTSTTERIPAPVAPFMERASAEDILAQPVIKIEGNQDNIDPTLIDTLATLMVGRADIRSPYVIEGVKQQIDGITRIEILVAHYDPTVQKTKCYRLQYPLESLAKMSWLRSGEPIRTRKVEGWIAVQVYTFETTQFSTEPKGIYENNPNWFVIDTTLEVPIR